MDYLPLAIVHGAYFTKFDGKPRDCQIIIIFFPSSCIENLGECQVWGFKKIRPNIKLVSSSSYNAWVVGRETNVWSLLKRKHTRTDTQAHLMVNQCSSTVITSVQTSMKRCTLEREGNGEFAPSLAAVPVTWIFQTYPSFLLELPPLTLPPAYRHLPLTQQQRGHSDGWPPFLWIKQWTGLDSGRTFTFLDR